MEVKAMAEDEKKDDCKDCPRRDKKDSCPGGKKDDCEKDNGGKNCDND